MSTKTEMRFQFPALSQHEQSEHAAQSAVARREAELFLTLVRRVAGMTGSIRRAAASLTEMDALLGFAVVSSEQGYVAPVIENAPSRVLEILDGRHPVVEQTLPAGKTYVPNSVSLGLPAFSADPLSGPLEKHESGFAEESPSLLACDEMILCGPNASYVSKSAYFLRRTFVWSIFSLHAVV